MDQLLLDLVKKHNLINEQFFYFYFINKRSFPSAFFFFSSHWPYSLLIGML